MQYSQIVQIVGTDLVTSSTVKVKNYADAVPQQMQQVIPKFQLMEVAYTNYHQIKSSLFILTLSNLVNVLMIMVYTWGKSSRIG
jgi:hypothetical protein